MNYKDVYTQEELEKAIEESFIPVCKGDKEFEVTGNAQVTAYGNAQVMAYGNAQVTAYRNAQVMAYGSAQVTAYDSAQVTATQYVAVTIPSNFSGKITGGVQIKVPPVKTIEEWCEFYNVPIKRGIAIFYKGVDDDYSTDNARHNGITYTPGTTPSAPDWDGGEKECGGGLHFSPSPTHTLEFNPYAKHFIACPVKVSEIVVHYPAQYPSKVKAPRICKPCYEVDINGDPIEVKNA
jgi:hypothetical protein